MPVVVSTKREIEFDSRKPTVEGQRVETGMPVAAVGRIQPLGWGGMMPVGCQGFPSEHNRERHS